MALASYERALVSANSAFDRWYYGGDNNTLSSQQKAGFNLFVGKAGCSACHLVGQQYALLTDNLLHNTGIGYQRSMAKQAGETRVLIAPGEHIVVKGNAVAACSDCNHNKGDRYPTVCEIFRAEALYAINGLRFDPIHKLDEMAIPFFKKRTGLQTFAREELLF